MADSLRLLFYESVAKIRCMYVKSEGGLPPMRWR
jgi:hypothetical protein